MKNITVFFSPTKGFNKKVYTPEYIQCPFKYEDRLSTYTHNVLLEHLIINDNVVHLSLLLRDYPFMINELTTTKETLIHSCITHNAICCFKFLKMSNFDFNKLGLCYMNVYQEVLYKPLFWELTYRDISDDELYLQLTKPLSCIDKNSGIFKIMFEDLPGRIDILKAFLNFNKKVLYRLIDNNFNEPCIINATGEKRLIIYRYYNLEKVLEDDLKLTPYSIKSNLVKF